MFVDEVRLLFDSKAKASVSSGMTLDFAMGTKIFMALGNIAVKKTGIKLDGLFDEKTQAREQRHTRQNEQCTGEREVSAVHLWYALTCIYF